MAARSQILSYLPWAGGIVAGCASVFKHVFPDKVTKKNRCSEDEDLPFDNVTEKVLRELTDEFLLSHGTKRTSLFNFYCSSCPDISLHGSVHLIRGAYIGIPVSFFYNSTSSVKFADILPEGIAETVEPEVLTKLKDSLVLSEKAKKYAIAAEMQYANSLHFFSSFHFVPEVLIGFTFCYHLGPRLSKTPGLQKFLVLGSVLLTLGLYFVLEEIRQGHITASADLEAAKMGDVMLEGGIEYFSKQLARNQALRVINPEVGGCLYMESGDEHRALFSTPKSFLSSRLKLLQLHKKRTNAKEADIESTS